MLCNNLATKNMTVIVSRLSYKKNMKQSFFNIYTELILSTINYVLFVLEKNFTVKLADTNPKKYLRSIFLNLKSNFWQLTGVLIS